MQLLLIVDVIHKTVCSGIYIASELKDVTYEDFVKFVTAKNPDEVIDNHAGFRKIPVNLSWNNCAIGTFISQYIPAEKLEHVESSVLEYMGFPDDIAIALATGQYNTYFELQQAIAEIA